MNTIARGQWGFDGYVTSDCGAVSNIAQTHHYTNSSIATFGVTLPSGMDVGCDMALVEAGVAAAAVAAGAVTAGDIDGAVARLLRVRFRLGEFDPPAAQPYARIGLDAVCTPAHTALARESARQSLVLLHNPAGRLPLALAATRSVALIGPLANSSRITNGGINYAGIPCGGAAETLLGAFAARAPGALTAVLAPGCASVACPDTAGFASAAAAAAAADATVVVVGLDESIEDEALDRVALTLPGNQSALITAACSAARGPCIVVLMSGGGVDLSAALPSVTGGLLYAGFLGGHGAPAVVDTVFGDSAPAGRLTQTFYPADFVHAVSMLDMGVRPGASPFPPGTNPGRTYAWYTGTPVHRFGEGLSYTTWRTAIEGPALVSLASTRAHLAAFSQHGARFAPLRGSAPAAAYRVNVTNTGAVDSDYVVLGFLEPPGAGAGGVPLQTLFGFERVRVAAGGSVEVWLGVGVRELTRVAGGQRVAVPGRWRVRVGLQGEAGGAAAEFVAE